MDVIETTTTETTTTETTSIETTTTEAPEATTPSPATRSAELPAWSASDIRAWLREGVDGTVCAAVAVAWIVLMEIAMAVEPATSRAEPVIGVLLQLAMWTLLATMVTGLVMQRRFGLVASLGGAVLATAASIACPISGHHTFGTWWYGQMACVLGLVAVSVVALRRQPVSPGA